MPAELPDNTADIEFDKDFPRYVKLYAEMRSNKKVTALQNAICEEYDVRVEFRRAVFLALICIALSRL